VELGAQSLDDRVLALGHLNMLQWIWCIGAAQAAWPLVAHYAGPAGTSDLFQNDGSASHRAKPDFVVSVA
jgi:hypothetical protein